MRTYMSQNMSKLIPNLVVTSQGHRDPESSMDFSHLTTDCLIFLFTPECRLAEKRRELSVDRIFNLQ